jgi:multicomponent K+:H+ antiporter subunit A
VLYLLLHRKLRVGLERPPLLGRLEGQRIFERSMVFVSWRLARRVERLAGTRRLQPQLRLIVGIAIMAGAAAVWLRGVGPGNLPSTAFDPVLALVWCVGGACAIGAAWMAKFHRLAALILLGGAGLAVVLTFVWFSAPDLALTQLTVEVVTTVLLLLGLRWLPKRVELPGDRGPEVLTRTRRLRDLALALGAGCGLAALSYAVMTRVPPELLAEHFLQRAYTEGGGTNVVNVILVDFRGFDTLGEIFVVAAVALTAYALLRRFRPAADSVALPDQQAGADGTTAGNAVTARGEPTAGGDWLLVPFMLTRLIFPAMLVVAVFLLLRGHDLPGGGFSAGMVVAIAIILQYMIGGTDWTEDRLRLRPQLWVGAGLLVAAGTALAALAFGRPFLTTYFAYADLPLFGRVPTASALVFDIGIFALVVGSTLLMLVALAHQSVRAHRAAPRAQPAAVAGER